MGANVGPNVGASNFISEIIRKIADEADEGYVCKSTEENLYKCDKYNKERHNLKSKGKKFGDEFEALAQLPRSILLDFLAA